MNKPTSDDYYAGGGEAAEKAAIGTVKERKTFLTPIAGDEEFQFFMHGIVWVEPPPLWSMESPVAVRALVGLHALVDHVEERGEGHRSVSWFLRRVGDQDWPFVPAQRSLDKMPSDIQQHVINVCAIREHWLLSPLHDLDPELAYRLMDIAATQRRPGRVASDAESA